MARNVLVILLGTLTLAACGEPPRQAQQTVEVLTGDAAGPAADNPLCRLFRPAELEAYVGEPLNAGANAGMGAGCQWTAKDGEGDAMITAVPTDYAENPSGAEGYRAVADVGSKGFVLPELGGWAAGAVLGGDFVKVSVTGAGADADRAVALLRETAKRRTPA